jgi:hypothetical protein
MAPFNFTNVVPDEGTTFIFGLWVFVTDGAGNFHQHLIDNMKPEAPEATTCNDLSESTYELGEMLLPDLAREIEEQSVLDATPTHVAPGLLRQDLIQSEELHTRFLFGLRNMATVY